MMKFMTTAGLTLGVLSPLAQAQTVLVTSLFTPPHHTMSVSISAWCDDVAQATDRRVRCNILPRAVAGPSGAFDAVQDGVADLAFSVHGYTPGRYVFAEVAELPFSGDSAEVTSVAYQRIYEKHLAPLDMHNGVKVLTVFTHGPGNLYNTKQPVTSLADIQNMKWRVGGGMQSEVGNALNTSVSLKPATESFSLLSTGIVDGVFFPVGSVKSHGLGELVEHGTSFPGGLYNTSFAFVMNPAAWDGISETDQLVIESLSGETLAARFGRGWDEEDQKAVEELEAEGVIFSNASPELVEQVRKQTAGLEKEWIMKAEDNGLANASTVLEEYRREVAMEEAKQ